MDHGYRIVICGVRDGRMEEVVAQALALHLKHPAEQLAPVLRTRQRITVNVKGVPLQLARGLKETYEKTGCACMLESVGPMPPKTVALPGSIDSPRLRRFVNRTVGLALDAPENWRDDSDETFFRIRHSGTTTYITSSLNRSPGVDLQVWAEIRFGVIPDKMPYLKAYRSPFSLDTEAGPAIAAEFRGTVPGDAGPSHQLVLCLRPEAGAVSLNITSSVPDFERHEALYQWLLRTQLRLHEAGDEDTTSPTHPEAQYDVGLKHAKMKRHREAADWFRKAAEQGHAEAQFDLAGCYHRGEGVSQDYRQAFEWLRKSAEQGFRSAQSNLANMYGLGQGMDRDLAQAFHWLLKAAEQGDPEAQHRVSLSYIHGYGVTANVAMAAHWALKAAEQGQPDAQFYVGAMYEGGEGLRRDYERAIEWYQKAAAQRQAMAIDRLKVLGR